VKIQPPCKRSASDSDQQAIAARRATFATEREIRLAGRLLGHRPGSLMRVVSKIDRAMQSRSLRGLQQSLFKAKRQYCAVHRRYSRIHGFSYANRNSISQRLSNQQQATF
jgi:hypothetical protein